MDGTENYNYSRRHSQSSYSDEEDNIYKNKSLMPYGSTSDMAEIQGSIDGPINPINYSGTQINIWGFPGPNLANVIDPKDQQPNLGALTEQMIKVIFL